MRQSALGTIGSYSLRILMRPTDTTSMIQTLELAGSIPLGTMLESRQSWAQ